MTTRPRLRGYTKPGPSACSAWCAPRVPSGRGTGFSLRSKPRPSRPARYTAVAATHAASGTRRRAVAHGHANASATRGGRIRPLSCPLPTVRLRGRRPVIRPSFPDASLCPRFRPRPHRPDLQSQCLITPLPCPLAIIAKHTGEDDGERKGSVMKQTLYRLQSRAGLSLASTAAGAASEDSGSVRADVLSHLVGCEEREHSHE
jgi:hypothetical protein